MNDQPIDWKARAEKAEAKLERVQKQAAEMREAITSRIEGLIFGDYMALQFPATNGHIPLKDYMNRVSRSLQSDAGRHYHHRDEYKELSEASRNAARQLLDAVGDWGDKFSLAQTQLVEAMTDARSKGLIG